MNNIELEYAECIHRFYYDDWQHVKNDTLFTLTAQYSDGNLTF